MTVARGTATPWLPGVKPDGPERLRLFCFPYSGGGGSVFFPWRNGLGPAVEVCPVELPGRGRRMIEPPFTAMEPLADAAFEALRPWLDGKPFALFGHSMGALLAFELARRLEATDGAPRPLHLFASGHVAPQTASRETPIHDLPEPEFLDRLRQLNGTPTEVLDDPELRAILLPILRSDFEICDRYGYVPGAPLACGITAYGGLLDEHVPRADLERWAEQTGADFSLRMFPGDHFFINSSRATLLWALASDLTRLLERHDRPS